MFLNKYRTLLTMEKTLAAKQIADMSLEEIRSISDNEMLLKALTEIKTAVNLAIKNIELKRKPYLFIGGRLDIAIKTGLETNFKVMHTA